MSEQSARIVITPQEIRVSAKAPTVTTSTGIPVARDFVERDPYTGEYTITPSAEAQVLLTNNLRMTDDITINPIPNNYGLITWDGATLMVS